MYQVTLVFVVLFAAATPARAVSVENIRFDDLRPKNVCHQKTYGGLGIDPHDNVYVTFCGETCGQPNCALYQYNAKTTQRKLLGTYADAARTAGNIEPGEKFIKGHTHVAYLDGKLYMGSMSRHGSGKPNDGERGAHIFSYDIEKHVLEDISKDQPDGIFGSHQGIIQVGTLPSKHLLVAYTIGRGDLILYNTQTKRTKYVHGSGDVFGIRVMRQLMITPNGKIFHGYCNNGGSCTGTIKMYDTHTGKLSDTPYETEGGWIDGQTRTKDGKTNYFSTYRNLYKIDQNGTFEFLKYIREGDTKDDLLWGLTLSQDEKKLYFAPSRGRAAKWLHEYDIATKEIAKLVDFSIYAPAGGLTLSGDDTRDSLGHIYFVYYSDAGLGLLKVDISDRTPSR